jgi:adenine/guanine phosphoribosyltransferase-like PRPP-binding protein
MEYWQEFHGGPALGAPWREVYDAAMPDGSYLRLPMRDFGATAVAGMIANQASFAVTDRLSGWIAERVAGLRPDVVVGLPTLGHVYGAGVARALGQGNWVALGTSRKLWYEERLSVPLASITSPEAGRRLWLDPRLLGRLAGRRVLLVDDVISTGASARAGLAVLSAAGIVPVGFAVAMAQTQRWRAAWPAEVPVVAAFATPLFRREGEDWVAAA